jgi:hypothetical protein
MSEIKRQYGIPTLQIFKLQSYDCKTTSTSGGVSEVSPIIIHNLFIYL